MSVVTIRMVIINNIDCVINIIVITIRVKLRRVAVTHDYKEQ